MVKKTSSCGRRTTRCRRWRRKANAELYPLSEDTVRLFRQFAAKEPKQQESIMLDFNNVMSLFGNPVVAAATEENDFDLRDVRRKK